MYANSLKYVFMNCLIGNEKATLSLGSETKHNMCNNKLFIYQYAIHSEEQHKISRESWYVSIMNDVEIQIIDTGYHNQISIIDSYPLWRCYPLWWCWIFVNRNVMF